MKATTKNNDEIAERIKAVRSVLSENQKDFASKLEVGFSTYQKYEMGMSIPGGEAIKGFVRVGVNANWLLTGEGEMLLSDAQPPPASPAEQISPGMQRVLERVTSKSDVMMHMAGVSTPDGKASVAQAIDEGLLSSCHAACKAVYGDKFDALSPVVQMGYATDLYGLLVRLCASNGKDLGEMKRLEVNGLIELLKTYVRLGWSRKFPPPHDYGCFF